MMILMGLLCRNFTAIGKAFCNTYLIPIYRDSSDERQVTDKFALKYSFPGSVAKVQAGRQFNVKKAEKEKHSSNNVNELTKDLTLGELAHQIIAEQFQRMSKQTKRVLEDTDPEHLHQVRVSTRRLRTAMQIFDRAIILPKKADSKQVRNLARILGAVRDLDVQIASLQDDYLPQFKQAEQKQVHQAIKALKKQRVTAFEAMKTALNDRSYKALQSAFTEWIDQPKLQAIAHLPLLAVLPDVLSPLIAEVLLHSGWMIGQDKIAAESEMLHDLRKVCKHARYQTEFFKPFYGESFHNWIEEIKQIQDQLGSFQDTQVLRSLLNETIGTQIKLPNLEEKVQQKQFEALSNWDATRQKYLEQGFRYHLHQMLLHPTLHRDRVHPELMGEISAG
jgi:CHAD domain-containing protein